MGEILRSGILHVGYLERYESAELDGALLHIMNPVSGIFSIFQLCWIVELRWNEAVKEPPSCTCSRQKAHRHHVH